MPNKLIASIIAIGTIATKILTEVQKIEIITDYDDSDKKENS